MRAGSSLTQRNTPQTLLLVFEPSDITITGSNGLLTLNNRSMDGSVSIPPYGEQANAYWRVGDALSWKGLLSMVTRLLDSLSVGVV
ncbi:MAG TPA: hypothetical protein PKH07_01335 [bacterium]|nr:hypothetical protein [bacterium]